MQELDFTQDRAALVEYVADKLILAECGDKQAMSYIEFLWDDNPDLLMDAQDYLQILDSIEFHYTGC